MLMIRTLGCRERRETSLGPVWLTASDKGLTGLSFADDATLSDRASLGSADQLQSGWFDQVVEVVEHPHVVQDIPLDLQGTAFQQRVWEALRAIPPGETRSYGQIAAALGQPGASRAVGSANGANPIAVIVPCHRVIAADGSLGGYAYGPALKRELLRREREAVQAERRSSNSSTTP